MRTERVSFRHAVELLRVKLGAGDPTSSAPAVTLAPIATKATEAEAIEDAALVREVLDFYHETLKASPEAIACLERRGLNSVELIDRFRLGYANRTLAYRLPGSRWKAGATLRGRLQRLGFIRESGHEHFRGSIVVRSSASVGSPQVRPTGAGSGGIFKHVPHGAATCVA